MSLPRRSTRSRPKSREELAPEMSPEALFAMLSAPDKASQRAAVERMVEAAKAGDPRYAEALSHALSSPDFRVRWAGAYGLALLGDAHGAGVLCEALSSPDADLRWAAAAMLARLALRRETAKVEVLKLARAVLEPVGCRMALHSLRYMGARGEEILSVVEDATRSPSKLVRLAALSLLGALNDSSDRAAALAIGLVNSDPDSGVRRAAAAALGPIGNRSPAAIETLSRAAVHRSDPALARAAQRSLRRLGYHGNASN